MSTGTRRADWIPKQHGAWAMLAVPFVAGVILTGGSWRQVPLGLFWLAGYLAFYAGGVWVRARRRARYRPPLIGYAALAAVLGVVVMATSTHLVVWLPGYAVLAAASLWFSSRRRDRALANDAVTMLGACLFCLVTYQAGFGSADAAWSSRPAADHAVAVAVLCFGYFFGTALYVKTLIRERTSAAYRQASIGYHAAWTLLWTAAALLPSAPVSAGVSAMGWPVAAFFAVLTARAAALAGRRIRPMHVGLGEIAACVVLLILVARWQ